MGNKNLLGERNRRQKGTQPIGEDVRNIAQDGVVPGPQNGTKSVEGQR